MTTSENKRQVQLLLKRVQQAGCDVQLRRGGHYKIVTPDGTQIFCSQSPSDWRGIKRTMSRLRQAGVDV